MTRNEEFYQREYTDKDVSVRQLARDLGVSTSKVYRELKSLGVEIKTKSQVQKARLKTIEHPTAGKQRSEADKRKIGEGVSKDWKSLSDEDKKERMKGNLLDFSTMPKHEQDEIRKLAHKEIKKTAKTGSKIERFFHEKLIGAGYKTTIHKAVPLKEKLIVDLMLTEHNIVIEVDGVSHYEPIWGQEKLVQQQNADKEKNGILMSCGYSVIRFRLNNNNYNNTKMWRAFDSLKKAIEQLTSRDKKVPTVLHSGD